MCEKEGAMITVKVCVGYVRIEIDGEVPYRSVYEEDDKLPPEIAQALLETGCTVTYVWKSDNGCHAERFRLSDAGELESQIIGSDKFTETVETNLADMYRRKHGSIIHHALFLEEIPTLEG